MLQWKRLCVCGVRLEQSCHAMLYGNDVKCQHLYSQDGTYSRVQRWSLFGAHVLGKNLFVNLLCFFL